MQPQLIDPGRVVGQGFCPPFCEIDLLCLATEQMATQPLVLCGKSASPEDATELFMGSRARQNELKLAANANGSMALPRMKHAR